MDDIQWWKSSPTHIHTHLRVSGSYTHGRFFFFHGTGQSTFISLSLPGKKKRFPGPTSVIPAPPPPPSIPPLGCWSWWLINTFAYYSASISSLSFSSSCCCCCSFLFLLQLLFLYWLTSFPPWACQTAQASLFNHNRIKITSRKRKKKLYCCCCCCCSYNESSSTGLNEWQSVPRPSYSTQKTKNLNKWPTWVLGSLTVRTGLLLLLLFGETSEERKTGRGKRRQDEQ